MATFRKTEKPTDVIQDRVQELRRIRAGDLVPNPANWRRHPNSQRQAMQGILQEIGFADALLAYETSDGLMLVDGHLRAGLDPDQVVPVLVLDITEEEAKKMLVTLDPIAAMAQADTDRLLPLLESVSTDNQALHDLLEALANNERFPMPDWSAEGKTGVIAQDITDETNAQATSFQDKVGEYEGGLLHLICPECATEFSIAKSELTNPYGNLDS